MGIFRKPSVAADGTGPSPIIYSEIPADVATGELTARGFMIKDDFNSIVPSTTTYEGYTVTQTHGTLVNGTTEGGSLVLTLAGADNDLIQLQGTESFYLDAGSHIAAEARFQLVDVLQTDSFFGLSITDTSIGATQPSDILGMGTEDGSANIVYIASKDTGTAYVDSGSDAVDATYVRLGFVATGESSVEFFVDGVSVAVVTTGLPNDEQLALSLSCMAGEGAANNMTIDWMYVAQWYDSGR